jgi:hypothetical protein
MTRSLAFRVALLGIGASFLAAIPAAALPATTLQHEAVGMSSPDVGAGAAPSVQYAQRDESRGGNFAKKKKKAKKN